MIVLNQLESYKLNLRLFCTVLKTNTVFKILVLKNFKYVFLDYNN